MAPSISASSKNSWVPKSFGSMTPPQKVFTRCGRLSRGADAVAPVVLVGEAAAGPAQHRDLQLLERREHVVAIAARVGNRRVFADPDAFVDIAAEVLHELAMQRRIDRGAGLVGADRQRGVRWRPLVGRECGRDAASEGGECRQRLLRHEYPPRGRRDAGKSRKPSASARFASSQRRTRAWYSRHAAPCVRASQGSSPNTTRKWNASHDKTGIDRECSRQRSARAQPMSMSVDRQVHRIAAVAIQPDGHTRLRGGDHGASVPRPAT